jgi:hypothetical protein
MSWPDGAAGCVVAPLVDVVEGSTLDFVGDFASSIDTWFCVSVPACASTLFATFLIFSRCLGVNLSQSDCEMLMIAYDVGR